MLRSGSGTNSYSISGGYSSFRGTLVYKDYDGASYSKSISGTSGGGALTFSDSAYSGNCSAVATATLTFTISSGWSFSADTGVKSASCSYEICGGEKCRRYTSTVYAQVKDAKITNLEVYR